MNRFWMHEISSVRRDESVRTILKRKCVKFQVNSVTLIGSFRVCTQWRSYTWLEDPPPWLKPWLRPA